MPQKNGSNSSDKIAIVTGGSRGLGRNIVPTLAAQRIEVSGRHGYLRQQKVARTLRPSSQPFTRSCVPQPGSPERAAPRLAWRNTKIEKLRIA